MRTFSRKPVFRSLTVLLALVMPAGSFIPVTAAASTSGTMAIAGTQDPTIIGLEAYNAMMKELVGLIPELVRDRPTGKENERETAFKALSAIYFAMIFGSVALTPGCAALGAGIGACFAGVGAGPGALIGGGAGMVLSVAGITAATIVLVGLYFYVNEKYPYQETAHVTRGIRTVSLEKTAAAQAGPYESLIIHLIDAAFPNDVIKLASDWDSKPGLTAQQREFLKSINPLRPQVEAIAEVKRSKRLFPNGPVAQPLTGWMAQGVKLISADTATMENLWINALGVGAINASVQSSKLTVKLPASLTAVGAPREASVPVPGFAVKVGGAGGAFDPYLKTSLTSGPFSVNWGSASLIKTGSDAGRIMVRYSIGKGSRLGRAQFKFKWNGPETSVADFSPTLASGFDGRIYFKTAGHGLEVDRLTFGTISLDLNLPGGIPSNLPGISDLVKQLTNQMQDGLRGLIKEMGWARALDPLKTFPAQSLLKELRSQESAFGLEQISSVQQLTVQGGKLAAQVRATFLNAPKPDRSPREVAVELAKVRLAQKRLFQGGTPVKEGVGIIGTPTLKP